MTASNRRYHLAAATSGRTESWRGTPLGRARERSGGMPPSPPAARSRFRNHELAFTSEILSAKDQCCDDSNADRTEPQFTSVERTGRESWVYVWRRDLLDEGDFDV